MPSVMTQQRFVKNIGVFPGLGETFLKTRPVLKGLRVSTGPTQMEKALLSCKKESIAFRLDRG